MTLHLRSFPAELAGVVSGWAKTGEEVLMWCGARAAPVPAEQISAWAAEDGVEQFGLFRDQRLVAYGELWVDDQEAEVELARLIVDPGERGQGLGRYLAVDLARLAQLRHPRVFLRVHPGNFRQTGFVERSTAQLTGPIFAQTLVFGLLANPQASYSQLRHVAASLGVHVSRQAVEQRFDEHSVALMRSL